MKLEAAVHPLMTGTGVFIVTIVFIASYGI